MKDSVGFVLCDKVAACKNKKHKKKQQTKQNKQQQRPRVVAVRPYEREINHPFLGTLKYKHVTGMRGTKQFIRFPKPSFQYKVIPLHKQYDVIENIFVAQKGIEEIQNTLKKNKITHDIENLQNYLICYKFIESEIQRNDCTFEVCQYLFEMNEHPTMLNRVKKMLNKPPIENEIKELIESKQIGWNLVALNKFTKTSFVSFYLFFSHFFVSWIVDGMHAQKKKR